ncbi:hypothetical protein WS9_009585 [Paraclostridium sordellii 8483]|uniref:hypothetical protein n=1 Tax=Paraclostridium sordellii TaxID=1505 RepID=UPI0006591BAF|nr:hypothetical protein [Paeniclostridium sordellii]TAN66820.1 hypothetical protein WS9_009585 [Paeniclostridium sordellii 8483]
MQQLLVKILDKEKLNNSDMDFYNDIKNKLIEYKHKRLSYSKIAQFVFENREIDSISYNLEILKSIAKKENDDDIVKIIDKINDHIELEFYRLEHLEKTQMGQIEKITNETSSKFEPISKKVNEYNKKIKKHEAIMLEHKDEIKNWNANIVTVLGLFSAIVLTFFGGMSGIDSIFENINATSIYRLVFMVLIVVVTMFNVIFMLLYYIGIITGKHLNRDCILGCEKFEIKKEVERTERKYSKVKVCKNKNYKCSLKRYPIIIAANIVCLSLLISMGVIYEVNKFAEIMIRKG